MRKKRVIFYTIASLIIITILTIAFIAHIKGENTEGCIGIGSAFSQNPCNFIDKE